MAKKTTPTPANETESAEPMTIAPAAAPATDEPDGVTAEADEALVEAAAVQKQPEKAEAEEESAQVEEAAQAEDASDALDEADTADEADDIETLETLDSLALRYRVPSWKQAAMLQMQGWAPGKHVSAADYETALADLGTRPLGGGARR